MAVLKADRPRATAASIKKTRNMTSSATRGELDCDATVPLPAAGNNSKLITNTIPYKERVCYLWCLSELTPFYCGLFKASDATMQI